MPKPAREKPATIPGQLGACTLNRRVGDCGEQEMTVHAHVFQGLRLQITTYNRFNSGTQFKGLRLTMAGCQWSLKAPVTFHSSRVRASRFPQALQLEGDIMSVRRDILKAIQGSDASGTIGSYSAPIAITNLKLRACNSCSATTATHIVSASVAQF